MFEGKRSFFSLFLKMIMKPKNVDLETILAPLGRPSEAMLAVLGGLWRPCRASWRQLEPNLSQHNPNMSQAWGLDTWEIGALGAW